LDEADNGDISGCMVVDASSIDPFNNDSEDLTDINVGFDYTDAAKVADIFLRFGNGNAWVDGLCIEVIKVLTASSLGQMFAARGLMEMKAQFMRVDDITELLQLRMRTVFDHLGIGVAVAKFVGASLSLGIDIIAGDYLDNDLFDNADICFFKAN